MKTDLFETIDNQTIYRVPLVNGPLNGTVEVPGSKSITNRALLIAALAKGRTVLRGVLFSDDSRHFLSSLISLGFDVLVNEADKTVVVEGLGGNIPNAKATIDVGSAGTAARFLTAMLALSHGEYTINCSEQMKKRPMKPLFDALVLAGATITYLENEGFLPIHIIGNQGICHEISMDISKSTQFLSALLMVAPMTHNGMLIHITSDKKDGAYIRITRHMMEQFHVNVDFDGSSYAIQKECQYKVHDYRIEPDVSAACYFYAIAALTGGSICVVGVQNDLMQGDMKFLDVLVQLGCTLETDDEGIRINGPAQGIYPGLDVDMNDFSDQTMTLAALAVFATSSTQIRNVSHICLQECDRMQATVQELTKIGITCKADGENIIITPSLAHAATIETYDDHRMAMAFSLLGLKIDGIVIDNPMCCKKTFENYFEVFSNLIDENC